MVRPQKSLSVRFSALCESVMSHRARRHTLGPIVFTSTGDAISIVSPWPNTSRMHTCSRVPAATAGPKTPPRRPSRPWGDRPAPPRQPRPARSRLGAPGAPYLLQSRSRARPPRAPQTSTHAKAPPRRLISGRRDPARSAHATHTPARAAALPSRMHAPAAAHQPTFAA